MGGVHRHADLGARVSHRRALRPGREPGGGHVRHVLHRGVSHTYWGTWHGDPAYRRRRATRTTSPWSCSTRRVEGITPARLPAAGSLSNLPNDQQFTSGRLRRPVGHERPRRQDVPLPGRPLPTVGTLNTVTPAWLRISGTRRTATAAPATATPAARTSSAPAPSETNIIAGTTITGDTPCRSTNVDYRLDTASARSFLGQYVTLP